MSTTSPDSDDFEIDGLPIRSELNGRDPIEEIASMYLERLREGESTDIEFFVLTNPDLEDELREFLPLVAAMEEWKSRRELDVVKHPLPEEFQIEQLGDCRVIREIARGGMGVVFEAEQEPINRSVAVKLLPWKFSKSSRWTQQFHREARIAARLHHAHIVPVFSFGEEDGRFYYVMQLIQGIGLDRLIESWRDEDAVADVEKLVQEIHPQAKTTGKQKRTLHRDNWGQIGKIAAQVIGALRFAHKQQTLHRDIKPSNLLIDIDGKLWVTDFGLALARDHQLSGDRDPLAGTMRYMAPEQFQGEGDERSDLYSFGATLYELCTLQPVFSAKTKKDLLVGIKKGKVTRPRKINSNIPSSLESIILRALHHDPIHRYQTAQRLHRDLLQFVNDWTQSDSRGSWSWLKGRRKK